MNYFNSSQVFTALVKDGVWYDDDFLWDGEVERFTTLAQALPYQVQDTEFGSRKVKQVVESIYLEFGSELRRDWENELISPVTEQLSRGLGDYFEGPLHFNEAAIQRYPHATLGIERHRDESKNRNLIVLLGLDGEGTFSVYPDLNPESVASKTLVIRPGGMLVMVGHGFVPTGDLRPVHNVQNIIAGTDGYRYLLGLRQTI